ncbi:MAG: hypothetical protein PHY24_02640, partial [Candidatus Cloacimonetes bacterium]|nr:hypothetical protein [Candidatus Cloacimonadota bacterium]
DDISVSETAPDRYLSRNLLGYNIYRDGGMIVNISDADITSYIYTDLPNGDYLYAVTASYSGGESQAVTVNVTVDLLLEPTIFEDGFEDYPDFAVDLSPWTNIDCDHSPTYITTNFVYPGMGTRCLTWPSILPLPHPLWHTTILMRGTKWLPALLAGTHLTMFG